MRTFQLATAVSLLFATAGGICIGWVGVLGGLVLAFGLWVMAIVLNAFAVLLDCLVNPLGGGREYTFRYPGEKPGNGDDKK